MIFAQFVVEVNEANVFIAACEETREALLVDAACMDPRIPRFLEAHDLRLTTLFITHDHFDHTGGVKEFMERYPRIAVHSGSGSAGGVTVRQAHPGDTLVIGTLRGTVIPLPGHTPESIGLVFPGDVFTGDALFAGSVGGTRNATEAQRQLQHIREHLFPLPDTYRLHTGHGPSSTIGIEKRCNPFFTP